MTPLTTPDGGAGSRRIGPYRVLRVVSESGTHGTYVGAKENEGRVRLRAIAVPDHEKRGIVASSWEASKDIESEHLQTPVDVGTDGDYVYAALVDGTTLPLSPLSTRKLAPEIVASIGVDVATGLHTGHRHHNKKLVHHALSLEALHVDRVGRALVEGLFVAPEVAGDTNSELPLWLASPEWVACGPFDARSDVYALGAMLWSLLAGRPLFEHLATPSDLIKLIRRGDIPPPSSLVSSVPPALDAVVIGALRRAPRDRPASAMELANQLRRAVDVRAGRARLADLTKSGSPSVPPKSEPLGAKGRVPRPQPVRIQEEDGPESDATIVDQSPFFEVDETTVVGNPRGPEPPRPPASRPGSLGRTGAGLALAPASKKLPVVAEENTETETRAVSAAKEPEPTPIVNETTGGEEEATRVKSAAEVESLRAEQVGRTTAKMAVTGPPADPGPPLSSSWSDGPIRPIGEPLPRIMNNDTSDDGVMPPVMTLPQIPGALPAPLEPMRAAEQMPRFDGPGAIDPSAPEGAPKSGAPVKLIVLVIVTFLLTAAITALVLTRSGR